jgi:hypothetical protein
MDFKIPMKAARFWDDPLTAMYQSLLSDDEENEDDIETTHDCNCFDNMMDAKYEKVDPAEVAKSQSHLSTSQQ